MRLESDYRKYCFRTHDDILAARSRMPKETFRHYFKFAFVRNPWERLVSEYEYILSQPKHGRHKRVSRLAGFPDFIRMQIPRRDAFQVNMLCDGNGLLLVDFVGKLENLQADWATVCREIKIPVAALPWKNETGRRRYQDYYDHFTIERVAKHWAAEIELFGYTFDG